MRCWGCIPIHSKGKEYGKGLDGQLGLGERLVRSFTFFFGQIRSFTLKTPYPFWALSPPMLKKTTIKTYRFMTKKKKTYRFTSTHSLDQKNKHQLILKKIIGKYTSRLFNMHPTLMWKF